MMNDTDRNPADPRDVDRKNADRKNADRNDADRKNTEEQAVTTTQARVVLAIDLGKTSCRARAVSDGQILAEAHGAGAPGLADHNGARLAFEAVEYAARATGLDMHKIACVGIGAAGVEAGRDAVPELIRLVRENLVDVPVAVINDALAAHVGAFAGGPGTILITGTGAICFDVTEEGQVRQIDGWGPWLGDDGSGQWIGRHGLRAVLRALDGRGEQTELSADAALLAGTVERLPQWISELGAPARRLGMFAPHVMTRASEGDAVAVEIIDQATRLLAGTCAASGDDQVCVAGGLFEHPYFSARLRTALDSVGVRVVAARGDALAGSALVATGQRLPHEARIVRG
jgi:glucosamine kinase